MSKDQNIPIQRALKHGVLKGKFKKSILKERFLTDTPLWFLGGMITCSVNPQGKMFFLRSPPRAIERIDASIDIPGLKMSLAKHNITVFCPDLILI